MLTHSRAAVAYRDGKVVSLLLGKATIMVPMVLFVFVGLAPRGTLRALGTARHRVSQPLSLLLCDCLVGDEKAPM